LIERADVSRFPAISMPTPDIIAVGAFTYLLSRGVSNVAEGVQEKMKQAAEASAAATAEVSSATEATTAQALAAASTVEKTASPPLAVGQTTDSGGPQ
jgi:hypothetical protein